MRRIAAVMTLLFLPFLVAPAARTGEHPWNNRRIYYVIENQGRLVEKGYFVRRVGSYEKRECLVLEEEKAFYGADPSTPIRTVRTRTLTTLQGGALQRVENSLMGDGSQETITVAGGEARIVATGAYGRSGRVPVPDDVLFEVTGEWLAARPQQRGRNFAANVLDRLTHGVITTDVRILEREPARAGQPAVWRAEIVAPSRPPVVARYTADGRLLRMEGAGMVFQVVGREDYELGRLPLPEAPPIPGGDSRPGAVLADSGDPGDAIFGDVNDLFPDTAPGRFSGPEPDDPTPQRFRRRGGDAVIRLGATVPAWDSFSWLVLHGDPAYEWSSALNTSEYCRIDFNGVSTTIVAMRNAPAVDPGVNFPLKVPADLQAYLTTSDLVPTVNPAIIEAAYVAVADTETRREEPNVLKAVSFVAGWINQEIAVEGWTGYDSSAYDTLMNRSGDSLGHARLFSAMARTLGVPTRVCQGFLVQTGRAVNHCWSEAWINGKWIPVDTTVSRVGLPAGYVLSERSQPDGSFLFDFADFMRGRQLRLALASAGRETPGGNLAELFVGSRSTYAYSEGDWLANLYWGFALRLPHSWTGQARLNSVELHSGDRRASARCEALEGDFRAGREELEATVASLRSNLDGFKVVDSRVVPFDPSGSTPAIFVDFTCVEGGSTLRCRQYVIPRRQRAFRISFWAPNDRFTGYTLDFDSILASLEI